MNRNRPEDRHFLEIINNTPLVSVDLIIENNKGEVLLGKRVNRPAKGFWFVPGGRIRKNETIANAMKRISLAEVGFIITKEEADLLGTYDHIYKDNYMGIDGINTHYVVLAFQFICRGDQLIQSDEQHSEMKWWTREQLLMDKEVHPNTKAYFM